jgi:hypothetical protein
MVDTGVTMSKFAWNDTMTVKGSKKSVIKSEYGEISYKEWCQREATRIGNGHVYEEKGNLCWVK